MTSSIKHDTRPDATSIIKLSRWPHRRIDESSHKYARSHQRPSPTETWAAPTFVQELYDHQPPCLWPRRKFTIASRRSSTPLSIILDHPSESSRCYRIYLQKAWCNALSRMGVLTTITHACPIPGEMKARRVRSLLTPICSSLERTYTTSCTWSEGYTLGGPFG